MAAIGLGLAALGRPGYINLGHAQDLGGQYDVADMERRAHAVLDAAWDSGVRYFDAARSYGRAEQFLAGWLARRELAPSTVTIASKWGYVYTAGWKVDAPSHEVKEHSVEVLRRQWRESRALLGDHLALYQIHSATLESGVLENRAVLAELHRIAGEGVAIGASVSGPRQADVIRSLVGVAIDGVRLFSSIQATWNLLEQSAAEALGDAHAAGLRVIVKEALANGRLTARNTGEAFFPMRQVLAREARRLGTTVDALALAAALARPWAGVVLSGAATVEQLRSNLGARDVAWDEEASSALMPLALTPGQYWDARSRFAWN